MTVEQREFGVLDHGFVRLVDTMPQKDLDEAIVQAARVSYAGGTTATRSSAAPTAGRVTASPRGRRSIAGAPRWRPSRCAAPASVSTAHRRRGVSTPRRCRARTAVRASCSGSPTAARRICPSLSCCRARWPACGGAAWWR